METRIIDGIEFRQSPTWPTVFVSNTGLVQYQTGKITCGSLDTHKGYYVAQWYPMRGGKKERQLVHRLVADAWLGPNSQKVDHLNGHRGDNRLENLRYVTNRENSQNKEWNRAKSTKAAGYVGVRFMDDTFRSKPWQAHARVDGRPKTFGQYATKEEAAKAYDNFLAARGLAPVNFPLAA